MKNYIKTNEKIEVQKAVVILQQVDQDGNVLQSYKVLNPLPFSDGNGFDYCYENGAQGWAWNEDDGKKWELIVPSN